MSDDDCQGVHPDKHICTHKQDDDPKSDNEFGADGKAHHLRPPCYMDVMSTVPRSLLADCHRICGQYRSFVGLRPLLKQDVQTGISIKSIRCTPTFSYMNRYLIEGEFVIDDFYHRPMQSRHNGRQKTRCRACRMQSCRYVWRES